MLGWFKDRLDEVLRIAGDRGGVAFAFVPCIEL